MLTLLDGTYLTLTPLSGAPAPVLTPYAARGLTQTFEVIKSSSQTSWLRRDVNGVLRSVADTRFRKYKTTVTCKDGETPCLDDAWIGVEVEVGCVFELSYVTGGISARPAVPGSVRTQGSVTYYRPLLLCMIEDIRVALPEYQAQYDWQVDFQEI